MIRTALNFICIRLYIVAKIASKSERTEKKPPRQKEERRARGQYKSRYQLAFSNRK